MDPKVRQSWEDFLNPDILRPRLVAASIYIASFEALKESIIENLRMFFWSGWNKETGHQIDPSYKTKVLRRSKSPVYASLDWLKEMEAINDDDLESFERVKRCRNTLAHELFDVVGSKGMPQDFELCFGELRNLVSKIDRWWILQVEIPTDPDFIDADIDENAVRSGREITLELLCSIALDGGEKARFHYEQFKKMSEDK